jgi:hypothetical protein
MEGNAIMTPFDTQKVTTDLTAQLRQAEQAMTEAPSLDAFYLVSWIQRRLDYYRSADYAARKRRNEVEVVQFDRQPDEGLL